MICLVFYLTLNFLAFVAAIIDTSYGDKPKYLWHYVFCGYVIGYYIAKLLFYKVHKD
jgi:hypothetical protein